LGLETISAQVPGFRGKRFTAGYNASSFFYFANFHSDYGISGALESTRFSYKTEVYANYTLSRKTSLGFSYYHGNQKNYFRPQVVDAYEVTTSDEYVLCKFNMFEIHLQVFRNNFVAPVGLYHQFGIGIVKYNLGNPGDSVGLDGLHTNGGYYHLTTLMGPADPFTCFKLSYHVGKTNPIGNLFYINTAIGVNFYTGGDYSGLLSENRQLHSMSNYLAVNFSKGMRTHNFFEIKIGLGWLAF
jgi:hypothetical protein